MRRTFHRHSDFDSNGLLKAPWMFWGGVLLQARAWWLTGLAMASDSDVRWISRLYPDMGLQILGLMAGVFALAILFLYPARWSFPGPVAGCYLLMLIAVMVMLAGDTEMLIWLSPQQWDEGWLALCADLACGVMLWPDSRLREVFFSQFRNDR